MSVYAGRREDSITCSLLLSEYTASAFRYISLSYRFRRTFCQTKISRYADIEVKMKTFHVFTLNMQISVYTIRNQITTSLTRKRRNLFSFLNKVISVKWFHSISVPPKSPEYPLPLVCRPPSVCSSRSVCSLLSVCSSPTIVFSFHYVSLTSSVISCPPTYLSSLIFPF